MGCKRLGSQFETAVTLYTATRERNSASKQQTVVTVKYLC